MTGTASNRGKTFMDFDGYKNQEWLRRRKLRLEQVRKQSNEIAKALRQKVSDEEKLRLRVYEKIVEDMYSSWKAEKLEELERKLKCALDGFGAGYRQAEEEPDPEILIEEKARVNLSKAQKRGEIAHQEELRRNKLAKEKLMSPIERKKITRKKEDLRSALVRSIPIKKQLLQKQELNEESDQPLKFKVAVTKKKVKKDDEHQSVPNLQKKVPVRNLRKKKQVNHKSCACKYKMTETKTNQAWNDDTVWINLNDIKTSSTGESEPLQKSSKSIVTSGKSYQDRSEGSVEFYDFSSRYYCKSYREYPHLVERIDHNSQELNANELARMEEDMEREEAKKKSNVDAVSLERGAKALRREKINRGYRNLIAKLEELSKKEKILKAQQRNIPSFLHMNDERLSERARMRQRIMDSKFESVYYELTADVPRAGLTQREPICNLSGGGDCVESDERPVTGLSFSPSNVKFNSPVTSSGKSGVESVQSETVWSEEKASSEKQLLKNINKTLKKGRKLRETTFRNWKSNSSEEEENLEEIYSSASQVMKTKSVQVSPREAEEQFSKCQESQTNDLKVAQVEEDAQSKSFDKAGDESIPTSTSTSYKSPPSVIRSDSLRQFLDYLEGISEAKQSCPSQGNTKFKRNVNEDYIEKEKHECWVSPSLEYYIEKLLNMTRECVANLSISSENVSTPNITDLDMKKEDSIATDSEPYIKASDKEEKLVKKSKQARADDLEKSIKNWKRILESKLEEPQPELNDLPDCPNVKFVECEENRIGDPLTSPKIKSRYDEITRRCSERIVELSDMLNKVRKDKERLLSSASGGSSGNLSKIEEMSEKGIDVEDADKESEVVPVRKKLNSSGPPKTSPVLEGFINRYNLKRPREETVSTTAIADSQSLKDFNESLESWPDVMDELLKKEILTSPFKWTEGEESSISSSSLSSSSSSSSSTASEAMTCNDNQMKPSSIESVIGNFRKEISKIKPFSLTESCLPANPRWSANEDYQDSVLSPRKRVPCLWLVPENDNPFQEESSVESINHHLTSLGLNWAKTFLKKNKESKALSSSSNSSEKKSSDDEQENYL